MSFVIGVFALAGRVLFLGSERIFLRKLKEFSSLVVSSWFFLLAAIFLIPFMFTTVIGNFPITAVYAAALSSLIYAIGFYLYVKALSLEEASIIAPLYNFALIWLLVLSFIFLRGAVTTNRVIGIFTIVTGMFLLYPGSLKNRLRALRNSKGSLLMIFGSVFLATGRIIDTITISHADEKIYAFFINLFIGLYLLIFNLIINPKKYIRETKSTFQKSSWTMILSGVVNGWSYLLLLIAIQNLQVTVAEPASLLSVLVTALFAKLYLGEKVKERLFGIVIILVGSSLLFVRF